MNLLIQALRIETLSPIAKEADISYSLEFPHGAAF